MLRNDLYANGLLCNLGLLITGVLLQLFPLPAMTGELPNERQEELIYIIQQDCGSCHGMNLKGGLGPPLTSETLKTKSSEELFNIISQGVAKTPMPSWIEILNNEEIEWIVTRLQSNTSSLRQD